MKITWSDEVLPFEIDRDITENENPHRLRMAIAGKNKEGWHICHEMTLCRDNLYEMFLAKKRKWGYHSSYGVCTTENDKYNMRYLGIAFSCDSSLSRIKKMVEGLNRIAKKRGDREFKLHEISTLETEEKYGNGVFILEGASSWNAGLHFSYLTLLMRWYLEFPDKVFKYFKSNEFTNDDLLYNSILSGSSDLIGKFVELLNTGKAFKRTSPLSGFRSICVQIHYNEEGWGARINKLHKEIFEKC